MIDSSDFAAVRESIEEAEGVSLALRDAFILAVERLGSEQASRLWWAAFAAEDASET